MTLTPERPTQAAVACELGPDQLTALPGRVLDSQELLAWVRELAADPELWQQHVRHDTEGRHFVSLYRDSDIDVWLLCWNTVDDTGWHDHDTSAGAVAVTRGAVVENRPRLGGEPASRTIEAGRAFAFGPDHIHRMAGAMDGSVSIHAYSPPLWRMGAYSVERDGTLRRESISYAEELRPVASV
jgi:hypothetical protein